MTNERNWGLFKITPRKGKKPDKKPMDLHNGSVVTKEKAFGYTLDEAKAKLNGGSTELGYLAGPDSKFVGIDLDDCIEADGSIEAWADDILGGTPVPNALTPSGTGLRLLQPRMPGDEVKGGAGERNNVGFFTTDTRGFTVPLELAENLDQIERDEGLFSRLLDRLGPSETITPEQAAANKAAFWGKWQKHWLSALPDKRQQLAVETMLYHIGPKDDYHDWLDISMGLHQLSGLVAWSVEDIWENWSRLSDAYNPQKNASLWGNFNEHKGLSIFTVLHHAKEAGFDIKPWQKEASRATMANSWQGFPIPEQTEVIEPIEDETVDLTRPTGLLGAIVDNAEALSSRKSRFFGLAGGLVAVAALSGHKFMVRSPHFDTPLNLQVLVAAPTGAGKESARTIVSDAQAIGGFGLVQEGASDVSIHTTMLSRGNSVMMIDEFGRYLKGMAASVGGNEYKMMSMVMKVFTSALGSIPERQYAKVSDNKPEVRCPFLSTLFTTTGTQLIEGLDRESANSGQLGRMLMLFMDEVPPLREDETPDVDETAVREAMTRLADYQIGTPDGLGDPAFLSQRGRHFQRIPMTDEARAYYFQARRTFDEMGMASDADESVAAPLWSRALETALRVAGVVAVGNAAMTDTLDKAVVDLETMQYAARLTAFAVLRFTPEAQTMAVEGDMGRLHARIEKMAQTLTEQSDDDGWFKRRDLLQRLKGGKVDYRRLLTEVEALADPEGFGVLRPRPDTTSEDNLHEPLMFRLVGVLQRGSVGRLEGWSPPKGL